MAIHHTILKKAAANGIILTEKDGAVEAFWPERNIKLSAGIAKMALQAMLNRIDNIRENEYSDDPSDSNDGNVLHDAGPMAGVPEDDDTDEPAEAQPVMRSADGIALDGAVAYAEGTVTADCPFDNESDDPAEAAAAEEWYVAWDEAADAATDDEEGKIGGSVVSAKYRARYAEMGHPTHCGDWLANTLNGIVANKAGTNIELFEAICAANGVDTSKYKHEGKGWEGRLRMTGRNLLAKRVFAAKLLTVPAGIGQDAVPPQEWMDDMARRFKKPRA